MARRYSFEETEDPFNLQHQEQPLYDPVSNNNMRPGAHPQSSFDRIQAARRDSRDYSTGLGPQQQSYGGVISPPNPTATHPYRDNPGRQWDSDQGYSNSMASNITSGADNFGERTEGGAATGIAGIAGTNAMNSGIEVARNTPSYHPQQEYNQQHAFQEDQYLQPSPVYPIASNVTSYVQDPYAYQHQYMPQPSPEQQPYVDPYIRSSSRLDSSSRSSLTPLGASAIAPAISRPAQTYGIYPDIPRNRNSQNLDAFSGFDPNSIADDGDDGLEYRPHRGSLLSLGHHSDQSNAALGGAAAPGGVMGALGGLVGRSGGRKSITPQYNPVSNPQAFDLGPQEEKSDWLKRQTTGRKKWKWIVGAIVVFVILGAIGGGVAGSLLSKKDSSTSSGSPTSPAPPTATGDTQQNGDLNKDSPEIIALMNNKNLHKVFPGIDYTPLNTQYPDCLVYPPSPNNVTRDLAVLSQLTNVIRLYGTDCNQTEMVMHSINNLGLNETMKVWLGVWQDTNTTTNARQLSQMYKILNTYGASPFVGVIIGNEVLFREDMSETQLETLLSTVRSNLTAAGINLPVATSDLGDKWTAALANAADYLMANVHPFFSGVNVADAAGWTYSFFHNQDSAFKTDSSKAIISETGWPSAGGMDCGAATSCTNGSVAGIEEMNTFMSQWVCQSLTNGSNYFWFEAFDEPWKVRFNTPTQSWEDKWGLMDADRNLKDGLTIPDCGGKTVDGMKVS
jgi:exo-beta-1,3-glucanase (GH17 family)